MAGEFSKNQYSGVLETLRNKVLIIDDDPAFIERASLFLGERYELDSASSGKDGFEKVGTFMPDVVILDIKMESEYEGLDVLKKIKRQFGFISVIIVSAYLNDKRAVIDAEKYGADECLSKSLHPNELDRMILRTIERNLVVRKSLLNERKHAEDIIFPVFNSPAMRKVMQRVNSLKDFDDTILITGPTGSGKEVLANWIHFTSNRAGKPFRIIDLPSLSPTLFESELFGHERGAFTTALTSRRGSLELAHGGTLVLDEIGDLPMDLQVKLLGAVARKELSKVGGGKVSIGDVRFLVLTNKNLDEETSRGKFRSDLYYRIRTFHVELPPLCERKEDILLLAKQLLRTFSRKYRKDIDGIDSALEARLLNYHWPGNIRELENIIKNGISKAETSVIKLEDVSMFFGKNPDTDRGTLPENNMQFKEVKKRMMQSYFINVLKQTNGDVDAASILAGIHRVSLYRYLQKLGIDPNDFRPTRGDKE